MSKNPNAVALGKLGGLKSAANMTKEERVARAKLAQSKRRYNRTSPNSNTPKNAM